MGHAPAKVDDKGRLKIPAEFRKIIEQNQARLAKVPSASQPKKKLLERLNYFGSTGTMDGQGRVLIPAILRRDAAIADDVVVIGSDDHLIVWNEERIQRRLAENPLTDEDYKELELHGV